MPARIVITGAPGSGKSEFLNRLRLLPRYKEYAFLDELARQLLTQNPGLREDPLAFHKEIYAQQTAREAALDNGPFISDRGTIDAFAFHPETIGAVGTTIEREYNRYSAVIQLGSSAALGLDLYVLDDVRRETIDDALAIEQALRSVWQRHPEYHFISAEPKMETKYTRFKDIVDECVDRAANWT